MDVQLSILVYVCKIFRLTTLCYKDLGMLNKVIAHKCDDFHVDYTRTDKGNTILNIL